MAAQFDPGLETRELVPVDLREAPPGHPYLFRVFESHRPTAPPSRHLLEDLDELVIGRGHDDFSRDQGRLSLTIEDPLLSRTHARIRRSGPSFAIYDAGSRNGTVRNGVSVEHAELHDGDLLEVGGTFFIFRASLPAATGQPPDLRGEKLAAPAPGLATLLPALAGEFARVQAVAQAGVEMLVQGESGAGKELIARAYHALSGRPGPFVACNCGALPATLVESELFGSKKGSFSGATEDRPGLIRSADGGTLFLDEIGDLPLPAQAALLRVLQEREVMPVGGTRPQPVNVRVCAATHRDLAKMARENTFRIDLLARIAGYTVHLPAVRKRREDLGLLIAALLRRLAPESAGQITFTPDAARVLLQDRWPLNVREMEKRLTVALALASDHHIQREHLQVSPLRDAAPNLTPGEVPKLSIPVPPPAPAPARLRPEDEERRARLIALLTEHKGNISAVARVMESERFQIRRWLQRYNLRAEDYR